MKKMPNLFVIGSQRAGTTSLHDMLGQHSDIFMSPVKEPYFFNAEYLRRLITCESLTDNKRQELVCLLKKEENKGKYKTLDRYTKLFENAKDEKYLGESSHYMYSISVSETIKKYSPHARIIVSLRNPTDRIISQYGLHRRTSKFNGSFEEYLEHTKSKNIRSNQPPLTKGLQSKSLKQWLHNFERSSIFFIKFDDFRSDPALTLKNIFSWLEINPNETIKITHAQRSAIPKSESLAKFVYRGGGKIRSELKKIIPKHYRIKLKDYFYKSMLYEKNTILPETESYLYDYFREDVEKLEVITGFNLDSWKSR